MNRAPTRDTILEALKALPEDASLDEIIERLLFLAKLEEGLRQSDARQLTPHDAVAQRYSR